MKVRCKFVLTFPDADTAEKVKKSLEVDNEKYIATSVSGNTLTAHLEAKSIMSLLHTTEDYLSCLVTAENVIALVQKRDEKTK